ncbi:MAG: amino acid permease, partial [Gammaproteobacteria bacterium]
MTQDQSRRLDRALTLVPAAALIVASVVGTGVFVKARVMTCNVGTPDMVLLVWFAAGLLSLAGALVYAELGSMMPRPGGEFHFLRAAFGSRLAFLFGWTKILSQGASAAAVSILCIVFFNDLLGGTLPDLALYLLPLGLIVIGTIINLLTMRFNGHAATLLTMFKLGLVLLVGLGAFLLADGDWGHYALSGADG